MTDKLNANKEKKRKLVAEMLEKTQKAKAIVLTNYQGLTHQQLESFKREIKKADAEFAVTKNTLLKRAFTEAKLEIKDSGFDQQTGTLFLYGDPVAPLKTLAKLIKDFQKPVIKYGIIDKKSITSDQVIKLSTLPSREVLIAQLLGNMKAPIAGLHRALNWNLQKFVMTINAISLKKSQG